MELYLQFGYGMIDHCRSLITQWNGGTVIMSPRDLNPDQLRKLSQTIHGIPNGAVLLDPQFYLPHADHERLCSHDYWPCDYQTGVFWQGPALRMQLSALSNLNSELGSQAFILPGVLAGEVDDIWLATQDAILAEAASINQPLPLYATIALTDDAAKDQDQVASLLESSERWTPEGYYLVVEHPKGMYLVDEPNWLANVLDIAAGLKLQGKRVIIGYCNHQMLIAASAKVDAIASGTWMNVRSFPPEKFRSVVDDDIKQRATWYYCPQALSEYKIAFLDIAHRQGVLDMLAPPATMGNGHAAQLFSGVQPTSIKFSEQSAFRHYLCALHTQALQASADSYDRTVAIHHEMLNEAEAILHRLTDAGVYGQLRDFRELIDVNRSALTIHNSTRGAMLRRMWSQL